MANNSITITDIEILAAARGLKVLEQKAFYKLATDGKAMYFSRTKSGKISRCDVSGYEVDHVAIRPPKKKNGKVTGQVVFTDADLAIAAIDAAMEGLTDGLRGTKTEPTAQ